MSYPHTRLFIAGTWQDAADGNGLAVYSVLPCACNEKTGVGVAHAKTPVVETKDGDQHGLCTLVR